MPASSVPAVSVLHSPRDEALGEKIATALLREGHKTRCLGEDPLSGDLLLEDGAAIVIWSNATAKLARLHEQAREALERGALIPVTVGGAHAPEGFEALPAVDLSGWGGDDHDPRWRFVVEELNLAMQRWRTEDGAVWQEAEVSPPPMAEMAEDELHKTEEGPPVQADSIQESPDPQSADPVVEEAFYADAAADERVHVEASYQLSADNYWPDAPAAPTKSFRFGAMPVVMAGGLGLIAATAAAIIMAPALLSSSNPLAVSTDPDMLRDGFGTVAFVQPISPVEGDVSGLKAQSDFTVTSFREGSEPEGMLIEDMSTDELASAQGVANDELARADIAAVLEEPVRFDSVIDDLASQNSGATAPPVTQAAVDDPGISSDQPVLAVQLPEDIVSQNLLEGYFTDCKSCPKMAALSAGSFLFGSGPYEPTRQEDEGPVMDITLARPFAIAASEVTYDQWDACFADRGCREYRPSDLGWGRGDRPVTNVSYEDAQSYVAWLSAKTGKAYRLPSEAEWEFAARGGGDTAFGLGKDVSPSTANFNGNYPFLGEAGEFRGRTTPVASFAPNDFGLYDMHGNLWEWTADCWNDSHASAPVDGAPVILDACGSRVLKGGAWNTGGWRLRSAHRINKRAGARENDIGFRVARDLN